MDTTVKQPTTTLQLIPNLFASMQPKPRIPLIGKTISFKNTCCRNAIYAWVLFAVHDATFHPGSPFGAQTFAAKIALGFKRAIELDMQAKSSVEEFLEACLNLRRLTCNGHHSVANPKPTPRRLRQTPLMNSHPPRRCGPKGFGLHGLELCTYG